MNRGKKIGKERRIVIGKDGDRIDEVDIVK